MTTIMAKLHFKGFASETTLYFIHSYLNNVLEILRSLLSKGNSPNSWSHLILVCETGPKCVFKRGYTQTHFEFRYDSERSICRTRLQIFHTCCIRVFKELWCAFIFWDIVFIVYCVKYCLLHSCGYSPLVRVALVVVHHDIHGYPER